jgi:hypothetical protein
MIVSITDNVNQALQMITSTCAAIVYHCKNSLNATYELWTYSPTKIEDTDACPLANDRYTYSTNIGEGR